MLHIIGLRKLSPAYNDCLALSSEWFICYTTLEFTFPSRSYEQA